MTTCKLCGEILAASPGDYDFAKNYMDHLSRVHPEISLPEATALVFPLLPTDPDVVEIRKSSLEDLPASPVRYPQCTAVQLLWDD